MVTATATKVSWIQFHRRARTQASDCSQGSGAFQERIREITCRAKGVRIESTIKELARYLVGWRGYFGFCETPEVLVYLIDPLGAVAAPVCSLAAVANRAPSQGSTSLDLGCVPYWRVTRPVAVVALGT